jgi:hypothetical protein
LVEEGIDDRDGGRPGTKRPHQQLGDADRTDEATEAPSLDRVEQRIARGDEPVGRAPLDSIDDRSSVGDERAEAQRLDGD